MVRCRVRCESECVLRWELQIAMSASQALWPVLCMCGVKFLKMIRYGVLKKSPANTRDAHTRMHPRAPPPEPGCPWRNLFTHVVKWFECFEKY